MRTRHIKIDLSKLSPEEQRLVNQWQADSEVLRHPFESPEDFSLQMLQIVGKCFIETLTDSTQQFTQSENYKFVMAWHHISTLIEHVEENPLT